MDSSSVKPMGRKELAGKVTGGLRVLAGSLSTI